MKKVSVIGHFAFGHEYLNGQTVKTKIVTEELCKNFGDDNVLKFDTHGGIKSLLKAPVIVLRALRQSRNIIMLPAHNGLRVYGRLLPFFRKFYNDRKLHYVVIGGWLPEFLKTKKGLCRKLKKFDWIYVETNTMKNALENMGFGNIIVMPNCKKLSILSVSELVYADHEPYKLCTFSRVMKEKGIEDAVKAVTEVNKIYGRTVYNLDIYGPVDGAQSEWFENLEKNFPDYIKYQGIVPYDKSVEVLKNYYALLFPTLFYTEGVPGTIIDAYAAGVPVISSRWASFDDIVEEGKTGFGYEFGNCNDLIDKIIYAIKNKEIFEGMKLNCVEKAREYVPSKSLKVIIYGLLEE